MEKRTTAMETMTTRRMNTVNALAIQRGIGLISDHGLDDLTLTGLWDEMVAFLRGADPSRSFMRGQEEMRTDGTSERLSTFGSDMKDETGTCLASQTLHKVVGAFSGVFCWLVQRYLGRNVQAFKVFLW
jgi:hypothetical protein